VQAQGTRQTPDGGDHQSADSSQNKPKPEQIEKALIEACQGRLSALRWFYTDWQHGGSLTAYAVYHDDKDYDVFVKVPVGIGEKLWTHRLQGPANIVPHLFAHGDSLGELEFAWVVTERLPYGPLASAWGGQEFDLLIEAVGRFYTATADFPVEGQCELRDWPAELDQARQTLRRMDFAESKRWAKVLKASQKKIKEYTAVWDERDVDFWCHGDMHLGNAMTRYTAPQGPAILIDMALVHRGNWVEDAIYFEQQYWGHEQALGGRKLGRQLAYERKRLGLPVSKQWSILADSYRALLAMTTPLTVQMRNDPAHMHAALSLLEKAIG
jgi:hypothetical protein